MAFAPYPGRRNAITGLDEEQKDGAVPDAPPSPDGADAGAPSATGPAPYMPNSPSQGTTARPTPQPSDRMPAMPAEQPRTFTQMQAMGEARPPAPMTPASGLGNPQFGNGPTIAQSGRGFAETGQALVESGRGMAPEGSPADGTPPGVMGGTMPVLRSGMQGNDAAPTTETSALAGHGQIFANDPSRPGSGYVMYNGQPVRIEGTTAAGLGADGQPKPVTAQDRYILEGGQLGDYVNPDDYNAWVNQNHGANTYTPAQQAVNAQAPDTTERYLQGGVVTDPTGRPLPQYNTASNTPSPGGSSGAGMPTGGMGAQFPSTGGTNYGSGYGSGSGNNTDILSLLLNGANGRGAGGAVQDATQRKTLDLLNSPSPYGQSQVQDAYKWLGGQIDDQFDLQRQAADESFARRGLGVSTYKAGRLNDLNIGQRSAKEGLAENLAQNYAQTLGNYQQGAINTGNAVGNTASNNQLSWLGSLMGYGQNAFNNDLATNIANQNQQNSYQDYILRLLGMGYGASA